MEKIRLGKTNLMVSRLGFGGIPIQRDTEDEAIAVVRRCLDLGVTFLDTANGYTTSEERIGKAIAGRREGLILATKSSSRNSDELKGHLQLSLKRLGVEYIDLYQFHNVSSFDALDTILAPGGPMTVVQEAKKAGVVKHIGFSSHHADVAKKGVQTDRFETIMFPFNFITYEPAEELLPIAREHDVGVIAMKPLDGGMIENVTLAFKYLLQFPNVIPIPGVQKINEIDEIIKVVEGSRQITKAEQTEMQRLREKLGKVFCRRCDYCQPCTAGISISLVMDVKSMIAKTQPTTFFSGRMAGEIEKAANCQEDGECEKRCPYHLPIRQLVKENFSYYQTAKKRYLEQIASRSTR